jgi:co-chaperonin GroES (HSP10)
MSETDELYALLNVRQGSVAANAGDYKMSSSEYYLEHKRVSKEDFEKKYPPPLTREYQAQRDPSCPIEPMPGYLVVKPEYEDTNTTQLSSGLWIVSNDREKPSAAPVVAIGDDTDDDTIGFTFRLGDTVIFNQHSGIRVNFGERGINKYIVLAAKVIIGRVVAREAQPSLPNDHD